MIEEIANKVKSLKDMSEIFIGQTLVTRMDGDFEAEWKFSPYGVEGDYDRDAYWVCQDEIEDEVKDLVERESSR